MPKPSPHCVTAVPRERYKLALSKIGLTYRFAVKDGALWLRVGSRHWERLDPTVSDEFIPHVRTPHDNRIITFSRDTEHRVVGFSIAFWRVKSLDFKKQ